MITKIDQLTNFGLYRQFKWGNNALFAKRNLIYGWNYSGKTTLSRLFQIMAEPSQLAQWQGCQLGPGLKPNLKLAALPLSELTWFRHNLEKTGQRGFA